MDKVLLAKLLDEAAAGLTGMATELCPLYDRWAADGVDDQTLRWMWDLLERLGFWAKRLELAADPEMLALFPSVD